MTRKPAPSCKPPTEKSLSRRVRAGEAGEDAENPFFAVLFSWRSRRFELLLSMENRKD
jgi:hypothetical protein